MKLKLMNISKTIHHQNVHEHNFKCTFAKFRSKNILKLRTNTTKKHRPLKWTMFHHLTLIKFYSSISSNSHQVKPSFSNNLEEASGPIEPAA